MNVAPELVQKRQTDSLVDGIAFHQQDSFRSKEDVILSKPDWCRRGGEVSETQWNDVLGVIAVQRERLDLDYLGIGPRS